MNMLKNGKFGSHDDVLESIADAIDIPEHLFEVAVKRYEAMGKWLERDASTIKEYEPDVSPQGSFLLGTVTRPIGDADQFDLDLVCTLSATKYDFTMAALKRDVGVEIKAYATANNMQKEPEDKRRCWTMEYADDAKFHMDILPALPDEAAYRGMLEGKGYRDLAANEAIRERAIAITDNTLPNYNAISADWPLSNPKGYAVWFKTCQADEVHRRKEAILAEGVKYRSVDDVPDHKVKTPLQRSIQLLKRHRDSMFDNDPKHKPISIIITTLAAHAYILSLVSERQLMLTSSELKADELVHKSNIVM